MTDIRHPPVSFNKDDNYLAVIYNSRVHVWDVNTCELRESPTLVQCTCLTWMSPPTTATPGKKRKVRSAKPVEWVAIGTASGDVVIWDILQAESRATMTSSDPVVCLCCYGDSLYSGHVGGHVRIWDTTSAAMIKCWLADKQQVTVISIISDDSLVTGNQVIKLWSSEGPSGGNKPVRKFPGHGSELRHITSLDEMYFVTSATADRLVNVWNVKVKEAPAVSFVCPEAVVGFSVNKESSSVTMVMLSDEGSLYVCQWTINESTKSDKPLLPSHHITMATEDSVPNPIPIWAVQLVSSENLICCYGYHVKPIIEKITIPAGQKEVCLFRKVTMDTGKKTGKPRKSLQSNQDTVTQLGPSNMVETLPLMSRDPKLQSHDPSQQGGSVSSKRQREIPTAQSLSNMLIQAIHSDDKKLMNTVLMTAKESSISETVQRLPTSSIVPFLQQLQVLVDTQPQLLERLLPWIHAVMVTHMSYLSTVPDVIGSLSVLRHLLDLRVNLFDKLCKLHGKLDLILTQAGSQDVTHQDIEPYTEVTMGMDDDNDDVSDDDLSSHDSDEASHDLSLSSDES